MNEVEIDWRSLTKGFSSFEKKLLVAEQDRSHHTRETNPKQVKTVKEKQQEKSTSQIR